MNILKKHEHRELNDELAALHIPSTLHSFHHKSSGIKTYMRRIRPHEQGFTLMESLLGLMVFVLLASLGLPTYNELVSKQRLSAATVQVMSDLMLARKRALSEQRSVLIIFDSAQRYRIWDDLNDNNRFNQGEITSRDLLSFGAKMKANNNPRFYPSGSVTGLPTIKLRHPGVSNQAARCITISITGRIKQARCSY